MIKALIFDIGGVILRTEDRHPRQQLEQRLGLQPGEAEYLVFNSEMGQKAQMGQITSEQLWHWVQARLKLDDTGLRQFQEEFWAGDRIDWSMIELIRSLHPRYQTAIISNAMDNLHETVARFDPYGRLFDCVVGSAYEKVMKPSPEIFLRTLDRLQLTPQQALFVDDFAHNIVGAQAVGLQTLHFKPGLDLRHELKYLGILREE
ncbi:MAG: HAD family phosphatase [Caldilineaceae bacterium]